MMSAEQKAQFLSDRCGKLTASRMADAMDYLKDGKTSSAKRVKLMQDLLAERLTGDSMPHYVSEAMEHGIEYEDEAADVFVELTGRDLRPSRFYEHPTIENFGATPDRELDDGLVEVKCPTTPKFICWRLAGGVPQEHVPQMLAQLACTGKKWCGFLAYDPRIREASKRLFMAKFEPSAEQIAAVEDAARIFLNELDAMFSAFVEA
jgi:predicted phage-related endonuclease